MSIKLRLLLSYIAMLIVPIVLALIVILFSGFFYISDIQKNYDTKFKFYSPKRSLSEGNEAFSDIKKITLISPESLENKSYLDSVEGKLKSYYAGIVVRKGNEITYSSPMLKDFDTKTYLPSFGAFSQNLVVPFQNSKLGLTLSQQDFYFSDGSEGSIFLVINIEPFKKAFQEMLVTDMILIIIILVLTNGALTYFVAGSIIKPLDNLKRAVNRIKDGDLDFKLAAEAKDEIGQVSNAIESMRGRLKGSLDLQLQYEENRKELISNISHDLKTPITTIKGYIEGIRDGVADSPEKIEKYINTIFAKTVYVDKLIDELFLYSKLDLNKLQLSFVKIDLQKFLVDIVEELRFDLEKENVLLSYTFNKDNPENVLVDVQQLRRVIVNILENSIKYKSDEKCRVEISLRNQDESIIVEIKDNGKGISREELPFVFDRFFRGDPSRNSSTGGSGLGLSISKKIIEEHGGAMWVESATDEGTSIIFTLKKYKYKQIKTLENKMKSGDKE